MAMSLNSILFYAKSFSSIIDYPFWEGKRHIKFIPKGENLFEGNVLFFNFRRSSEGMTQIMGVTNRGAIQSNIFVMFIFLSCFC